MAGRRESLARRADPRRIAAEAARRLLDGRETDPESALRSAALAAGCRDASRWPSAEAVVEAALTERRLFDSPRHLEHLGRLRRRALEAMRYLAAFEPRLVGGVLDGWAGDGAAIDLQLFTDEPDAVMLRLLELGLRPRTLPARATVLPDLAHERLDFIAGGDPIRLSVYRAVALRRRTTAPGLRRAAIAEVEALVVAG